MHSNELKICSFLRDTKCPVVFLVVTAVFFVVCFLTVFLVDLVFALVFAGAFFDETRLAVDLLDDFALLVFALVVDFFFVAIMMNYSIFAEIVNSHALFSEVLLIKFLTNIRVKY